MANRKLFSRRSSGEAPVIRREDRRRIFLYAMRLVTRYFSPPPQPAGRAWYIARLEEQMYGPKQNVASAFFGEWEQRIMAKHGLYRLADGADPMENISAYVVQAPPGHVFDVVELFVELWGFACRLHNKLNLSELATHDMNEALEDGDLPFRVVGTIVAPYAPGVTETVVEPAARALAELGIAGGVREFDSALLAQRGGNYRDVLQGAW